MPWNTWIKNGRTISCRKKPDTPEHYKFTRYLNLSSASGLLIRSLVSHSETITFDLLENASGIYFIRVNGSRIVKVVKKNEVGRQPSVASLLFITFVDAVQQFFHFIVGRQAVFVFLGFVVHVFIHPFIVIKFAEV